MGELSSVGWGWAAGRCVALGYVRGTAAAVAHAGTSVTVDLWGEAVRLISARKANEREQKRYQDLRA